MYTIEEGDTESQKLFCLEDDGEVNFLNAEESEDGTLTAEAQHFSTYGLVAYIFVKASDPIIADRSETIPYMLGLNIVNSRDTWLSGFSATVDGTVYQFEHGKDYVGFDHGVVLDTSGTKPGSKDPELENLLKTVTPDARYGGDTSSITISKTMPEDGPNPLSFRYVFASSEFDQEEKYNDIAGVFLRKNNGAWQCVSKLPNGEYITIKNLRAGKNKDEMDNGTSTVLNPSESHSYFRINNIGDGSNGFTTNGVSGMITTSYQVHKGDKIDIKFVIADVADTDRDSYLFIEENSITVGHVQNRVDYYDSNGDRIFYQKYDDGSKFQINPLPDSFDPGGRRFLGWKDYDGFTTSNSNKLYQPGDWTDKVTNHDARMIAQFEPVKSKVSIKLTKDGAPWTGYDKLYLEVMNYGYSIYYLKENGTPGTYEVSDIPCGTHQLCWYDGRLGDITVNNSGYVEGTTQYDFKTFYITTRLDGVPSNKVLTTGWYSYILSPSGNCRYFYSKYHRREGIVEREVPVENGVHKLIMDGADTGKTMWPEEGKDSAVVDYTTLRVTIHDDTKWDNADVKLKDASGKVVKYLKYNSSAETAAETDAVYEAVSGVDKTAGPYSLFIGDLDTGLTMKPTLDPAECRKEVTFYNARLTITGVDRERGITMDNGTDMVRFSTPNTHSPWVYTASRVFGRIENGKELPYRISVQDLADSETNPILSTDKSEELTYHKVVYYRYEYNETTKKYDAKVFYTTFVRHGRIISAYGNPGLQGFTPLGWTTTQWTLETAAAVPPAPGFFDFTKPIETDISLYAWYDKPEVKINGIVQCNGSGTIGATGWYRMPNASITGFDPGEKSVRYLQLDTVNGSSFKIDLTGYDGAVLKPEGSGIGTVKTITGESVLIDFGENASVSMVQAQTFLRNNILVEPKTGRDHRITVTVRDSKSEFKEAVYAAGVAQAAAETWKELPADGSMGNQVLSTGKYALLSGSNEYRYYRSGDHGMDNLTVAPNSTVCLFIKTGADVESTCTANKYGRAGIRLPSNSKLAIYGGGSLTATGDGNSSRSTNGCGAGIGGDGGGTTGESGQDMGTLYLALGSTDPSAGGVTANGGYQQNSAGNAAPAIGGGGKGSGGSSDGSGGVVYKLQGSKLTKDNDNNSSAAAEQRSFTYEDAIANAADSDTSNDIPIPNYKIIYQNPDGSTYKTDRYYHGKVGGWDVTLPDYVSADSGFEFLGWQIVQYAQPNGETQSEKNLNKAPADIKTLYKKNGTSADFNIPEASYGEIKFRAVGQKIGGVSADDDASRSFPSTAVADTIHTYKAKITVDGVVDTSRGSIMIGTNSVTPDEDGIYTLYTTETGSKNIIIGGVTVGTVSPDADPVVIEYETIKVYVKGKKPNQVKLFTTGETPAAGPSLSEEAYEDDDEPENGYLWHFERLKSNENTGPFKVYVDGEDTGQNVTYDTPVTITYYTLTAKVTPVGASTSDIETLELRKSGEDTLFFTKQDDEGTGTGAKAVFTITGLNREKIYKVYINGEETNTTAMIDAGTIPLTFTRYTTVVNTTLDGVLTGIGEVKLGTDTMILKSEGTYELVLSNKQTRDLYVGDEKVKGDVTPGGTETVEYFTVNYIKSGSETGTTPSDNNIYRKGKKAVLLGNNDLKNGSKTFAGWTIGDETNPRAIGSEVTVNGKITAKAAWKGTPLSGNGIETKVTIADNWFVYDKTSKTPDVTVSRDGIVLRENTDYTLSYSNTNGGADNTTNAGDITITVKGMGDFSDSFTTDPLSGKALKYTINPANLSLAVSGDNKEYDGKTDISLSNAGALTGVVTGDDVTVNTGASGQLKSPDVGEDLPVTVDVSNLQGSDSSNYRLRPADPVLVKVTKRELTAGMFEVSDQPYTGEALTPELTLKDIKDQSVGNILHETDFTAVYSDNAACGTAKVTISANEFGNYKNPASGPIVLTFNISKSAIPESGYTAPTTKAPLIYNGRVQEIINSGSTSCGTVLYSYDNGNTWSETVPSEKDIGSWDISWKIVGDANHNDKEPERLSGITMEPLEAELQWENTTFRYNGSPQSPGAIVGNMAEGDNCLVTVSVNGEHTDPGDYTVSAVGLSDTNYKLPDNATQTFTIVENDEIRDNLTETQRVRALSPTYDGQEHYLVSGPNAYPEHYSGVKYRVLSGNEAEIPWSDEIPSAVRAGEYIVQVKYEAETQHYADVIIEFTAPIKRKDLSITAKDTGKKYGEEDPALEADVTGAVEGDEINYSLSRENGEKPGKYVILVSPGDNPDYNVSARNGTFTIEGEATDSSESGKENMASFTVTADGKNYTLSYVEKMTYDGRKHMGYPEGKDVMNTKSKDFDMKVMITDQDGNSIDPKRIKVRMKKNKNAGPGKYTVKVKGKEYKALNRALKKSEYREKLVFNIAPRPLEAKDVSIKLNKKGTKIKKVIIHDRDGYAHKLNKKDYEVESFDPETKTAVIHGQRNTEGTVIVHIGQ